jgi:hypothetical protein
MRREERLTAYFSSLPQKRIARDPDFRNALLRQGIDTGSPAMQIPAKRSCAITSR